MSPHWRLAFRYAAWVFAGAIVVAAAVWLLYGATHAGAFLYGVGVGTVSFVSTAFTVSMLTGSSKTFGMLIGGASFAARYGFAAGALGIPVYMNLWPVVAMLVGFAGVYLAENVVLLPGVLSRVMSNPSVRRNTKRSVRDREERRVEI